MSSLDIFLPEIRKVSLGKGKSVYVRQTSAAEADKYVALVKMGVSMTIAMLIYAICDKDGKLALTEEDADKLKGMPAVHFKRILDAANDLNSIPDDAKKN